MEQSVIKARYFREQLAIEIQEQFPFIGEDFLKGMNSRQVDTKYNIAHKLNKKPGKAILASILMAIGGFKDMNNKWVDGLVPRKDYNNRTSDSQWKGISYAVKNRLGQKANDVRMLKKGMIPWTDDERYMIWLATFAPDKSILDKRKRIKRNHLTELLNSEFSNNRDSSSVRNIISGFRRYRKSFVYQ